MSAQRQVTSGIACRTSDKKCCEEAAMVLEAVGIDSQVLFFDGEFLLIVRPEDEFEAREQLVLYAHENEDISKSKPRVPPLSRGLDGTLLYVTLLILVDGLIKGNDSSRTLLEAGSANAGLIWQGQWWRAVTALTLHADIVHLTGNIAFGSLFGLFACQALGSGVAWFSILMAGAAGNILSASLQTPSHTSIGASTAVFAALGIQAAYTCVFWRGLSQNKIRRWSPIVGGIMLLAFLGGPGPKIDVLSHVTGFLAGSITGALFGLWGMKYTESGTWQTISGALALFIIALSWSLALNPQLS
ncbi:MAG: rhomboid family intramembrane serine protease [Deltaproteobacteria bacterium]|nr:rhomboid family intramembrane serine protease [Deltaproteobacteria bacterium]